MLGEPIEALGHVEQVAAHLGELGSLGNLPDFCGDVPVVFGCR
jgi:hypothetical protein